MPNLILKAETLTKDRVYFQSILQKPCFVTSSVLLLTFIGLLQNKQLLHLLKMVKILQATANKCPPRISAHSQGPRI